MRPQHITSENWAGLGRVNRHRDGFNEAAAYHCGKRGPDAQGDACVAGASMRPQHITAENAGAMLGGRHWGRRFNEAAAYHCGKRPVAGAAGAAVTGLQ